MPTWLSIPTWRQVFRTRARRCTFGQFLRIEDERDFLEVGNAHPSQSHTYGGAAARPIRLTHHNQLTNRGHLYLACISFELYL